MITLSPPALGAFGPMMQITVTIAGTCPSGVVTTSPLPRRVSIPSGRIVERDYFLALSGHRHRSQPQPVHAWYITRAS